MGFLFVFFKDDDKGMTLISAMNFFFLCNLINSVFLGDKTSGALKAWHLNSYCYFFQYNRAFIVSFHNKDTNNKPSYFMHTVLGAVYVFFLPPRFYAL